MGKIISKDFNSNVNPCIYKYDITFSCYDVNTGAGLNNLNILINDELITDFTITESTYINGKTKYMYEISGVGPKIFTLTIEKQSYFPFSQNYQIKAQSIYSEPEPEYLGDIPFLSEIKTNAIVLTWGNYPSDLDAKLINPDGTITSVEEQGGSRKTYYSMVDIDDRASFGPETISFSKWTNWDSKYKTAGTFNYRVNWYNSRKRGYN